MSIRQPLYGQAADQVREQLRAEPSDLAVAVSVAQQMLAAYAHVDYGNPGAVAQAHGAIRESLRILLHTLGAEAPEPRMVRHANGLTFKVIPADSYDARIARDVRELTMDDGTVWTVGTCGAGSTFAWRPTAGLPALRRPAAQPGNCERGEGQ